MYILDTDIIIWILRKDKRIIASLERIIGKGDVAVSTITVGEIYKHVFPSEISSTEALFDTHDVIAVSREIAKEAGYYWQQFHKRITTLSLSDCMIAATAKMYNATLITLNSKHFPMKDIIVQRPRFL